MRNSTPASQVPLWPKKSTAFVVIHGSGPHRPFEALDSFVRGFSKWRAPSGEDPSMPVKWRHELRRRNGWIESYVSIVPMQAGNPALDFYEYYWDCYMTRNVTVGQVADCFDEASAGALAFQRFRQQEVTDTQAKAYWRTSDQPKQGNSKSRGYTAVLLCLRILARFKFLIWPLRGCTFRFLANSIGDVVIYISSDVRSANYETRQKLLSNAVEELNTVLKSGSYEQVVVVGHSLGSIIAYDALNRITLDMNTEGGLGPYLASKIKGLVTLGSPLDKTAFYYDNRSFTQQKKARREQERRPADKQKAPQPFPQQWIVSHLHSFRRIPLAADVKEIDIEDPIKHHLDETAWLNFHHTKDLRGGRLIAYSNVENVECTEKVAWWCFWEAHNRYWGWDGMYESIAGEFFK